MFVKEAMRTHSRILATEEVSMGLCHRAGRPWPGPSQVVAGCYLESALEGGK